MRKKVSTVLCIFALTCCFSPLLSVQTNYGNIDEISTALKDGSSRELVKFFDNSIELNLVNKQSDYSKNQAEIVMRDFFKKFPPNDFEIIHKGESTENIRYFIGKYESRGTNFRILIKSKLEKRNHLKIYSMDFTKG